MLEVMLLKTFQQVFFERRRSKFLSQINKHLISDEHLMYPYGTCLVWAYQCKNEWMNEWMKEGRKEGRDEERKEEIK